MAYKIILTAHADPANPPDGKKCPEGFKEGDRIEIANLQTPGGMCEGAYYNMIPAIKVLRHGGGFGWGSESVDVPCPCPEHVLMWKVSKGEEIKWP